MSSRPRFELSETHADGWLCLAVAGELDLATVPRLETRLRELHAENRAVRVDLSGLLFMDSAGLHLFLHAVEHARSSGWPFEVQRDLSPQVRRLLALMGVEDLILTDHRQVASS